MSDKALKDKLETLVQSIMDAAAKDDVKLADKVDALKTCAQFYVNLQKLNRKPGGSDDEDEDKTPTMAGLSARIKGDGKDTDDTTSGS